MKRKQHKNNRKQVFSGCGGFIVLLCGFIAIAGIFGNSKTPKRAPLASPTAILNSATNTQQPTKTATKTATKTPVLDGCVSGSGLRVRSGPGTEYDVIGGLTTGTCVSISGRNNDSSWVYVSTSDKLVGWVAADFIEIKGDVASMPIVGKFSTVNKTSTATHVFVANTVAVSQATQISNPSIQDNPTGASAICRDGTYSYSAHRRGTCSHHGGVRTWLMNLPP